MTTHEMAAIRALLEAKRAEEQHAIVMLQHLSLEDAHRIFTPDDVGDAEDTAADAQELEQMQALLMYHQQLLTEIEQALDRLNRGVYGFCIHCGKPLPEARLQALPWAARDIECEEEVEQKS